MSIASSVGAREGDDDEGALAMLGLAASTAVDDIGMGMIIKSSDRPMPTIVTDNTTAEARSVVGPTHGYFVTAVEGADFSYPPPVFTYRFVDTNT